jgi:hypothetical protein
MRLPLALCAIALTACSPGVPDVREAFIVAHPDDWQLFMGDRAIRSIGAGHQVTLVVLSGGGADRPAAYWQARERGATRSLVSAVALARVRTVERQPTCAPWAIAAHVVHRCVFGPAQIIFFRLPDGKPDGNGFLATRLQSLAKLGSARESGIDAIDGSARWQDWPTLAQGVRAAITDDGRASIRMIHAHDPDRTINPIDHSDHRAAGLLALELSQSLRVAATVYQGYSIMRRADNLPDSVAGMKAALFMVYDRIRMDADVTWGAYCDNPTAHAAYLFRTYARNVMPK